ncbi:alpha-amylase [Ceratobasidium sp. AG-Ba]|nr:alpha-amylase [Ceratobasidium sp. AG-Ba]
MLTRTTLASLAVLAASANAGNCTQSKGPGRMHRRSPNTANKVVVQMFGWNWKSIAAECESTLGPNGVGFAQVNPAQEHVSGDQWWVDYQAVSYQLQSKRGSRADFAEMIGRCNKAGVKIIADTILNHMAGVESGTGTAGTNFKHYEYPGLYGWNDFHHCGTPSDDINDWNNPWNFQTCELSNLADLNTGSSDVQKKLVGHVNDLLSLGVSGLRIDAAKHIAASELQAIVDQFSRTPDYITQEVVDTAGSIGGQYTGIGDVQEFRYPKALKAAFQKDGIASLKGIENRNWLRSDKANVFVVNHDQERGGEHLRWQDQNGSNGVYTLAHVFMLSYPYGTPTILSSFYFGNNDAGAPNGAWGTCQGNAGTNGWICQHRWTAIAGMIKFFNKVNGQDLNNWVQGSNQQIAFGRGKAGFVAINNSGSAWTRTFKTTLPNATYCDVITGKKSGSSCTGNKVTISGGSFQVTVPANSAVAYHIGAKY